MRCRALVLDRCEPRLDAGERGLGGGEPTCEREHSTAAPLLGRLELRSLRAKRRRVVGQSPPREAPARRQRHREWRVVWRVVSKGARSTDRIRALSASAHQMCAFAATFDAHLMQLSLQASGHPGRVAFHDVPAPPGAPSVACLRRRFSVVVLPAQGSSSPPSRGAPCLGPAPPIHESTRSKPRRRRCSPRSSRSTRKLSQSIEAYNAANVKLDGINTQLRLNKREMVSLVAISVLRRHVSPSGCAISTSGASPHPRSSSFLGASSFEDLINRLDTIDRVSGEDSQVLSE